MQPAVSHSVVIRYLHFEPAVTARPPERIGGSLRRHGILRNPRGFDGAASKDTALRAGPEKEGADGASIQGGRGLHERATSRRMGVCFEVPGDRLIHSPFEFHLRQGPRMEPEDLRDRSHKITVLIHFDHEVIRTGRHRLPGNQKSPRALNVWEGAVSVFPHRSGRQGRAGEGDGSAPGSLRVGALSWAENWDCLWVTVSRTAWNRALEFGERRTSVPACARRARNSPLSSPPTRGS